jgi:hypothetical protein
MHDDAAWTNDLYTLGTAYIDGHIAYDTRLALTRVPLVRQTAPTMRLNFRLGKPGAVLSSFLGVLDIKLGEWCAQDLNRGETNHAGAEIVLLFGVS